MPITIELPDLEMQTSFNLARWKEILADPELARLPYRIETDQYGRILMSPPPASRHGRRQVKIGALLLQLLPEGETISECPVSTAGGVRAVDVAWLAPDRAEIGQDPIVFVRAPDICVEILSPSNTSPETDENACSISTPAHPRSGFATSTDQSPFSLVLIINKIILLSVGRSQTEFPDPSRGLFAPSRMINS